MNCSAQIERIGSMLSVGQSWSEKTCAGPSDSFDDMGRELRVTAIDDPPYMEIHHLSNGSYRYDGYLFQLWDIIARKLDLRYRIEPLTDGGYGSLDENGTWSGMVGELAYGRADVSLSWLFLRPDRAEVVDYLDSVAVETIRETFYIPKNVGETYDVSERMYRSLLKPLNANVWWSVLISMLVLSIVLRIILRTNHRKAENSQTVKDMTWGSCILSSFMTLVGQGWAKTPDSLAARTATIFSWMLGIVIYTTYTTNLISHLTVDTVERPISSLEEFSKRSDWTLAVMPGHGVLNDWKVSSDQHLRGLFERSASGKGFLAITDTPENIRKLVQPKVLAYTNRFSLLNLVGNHACQMVTLEENAVFEISDGFLSMAKGMPKLRAAMNDLLRRLHELGVLRRLRNRWLSPYGEGNRCEQVDHYHTLSFAEFLPVLAAIVPGLILSVLLLGLEWGWVKFTKAKKRPTSRSLTSPEGDTVAKELFGKGDGHDVNPRPTGCVCV